MRIVRFAFLGLMSCALVAGDAGAQQVIINGSPPPFPIQLSGMGQRDVKTGPGRIRGRIVAADSGAPVRRAQVRITGNELAMKTSLTDGEGRFEFRDLPAGRFTLTAQKPGYMTVQYGQTRPFESGKTIELAEAQVMDKAEIAMPRGSVIAGRIADEFGDPIADATVSAMRSMWSNGRRRLQHRLRDARLHDAVAAGHAAQRGRGTGGRDRARDLAHDRESPAAAGVGHRRPGAGVGAARLGHLLAQTPAPEPSGRVLDSHRCRDA